MSDKKKHYRKPVRTSTIENVKFLSLQYLQETFDYNPDDGFLYWKKRPLHYFEGESRQLQFNTMCAGKRAGTINNLGYVPITLTTLDAVFKMFTNHIVWKLHGNELVEGWVLDHIDGIPWNNKLGNLRNVPQSKNTQNTRLRKDNKLGYPGIHKKRNAKMFRVEIVTDGLKEVVGKFATLEEAIAARKEAELRHRGVTARLEGWTPEVVVKETYYECWDSLPQDAHLIELW